MGSTDRGPDGLGPLCIVYGDVTLGIHGSGAGGEFHYLFSYAAGGMESLVCGGMEWLYRPPRPCFWRASTDNDRGNGFTGKSGMWYAADQFIRLKKTAVRVDGREIPFPSAPENNRYTDRERASEAEICYTCETITVPAARVEVAYQVDGAGRIRVRVYYHGEKGLPELPVFGMRFLMPTCADGFRYEGLSGETYPDRKAGGLPGIYEVKGLPVTPYLVPQDCGMHMDTAWVEVRRSRSLDNRNLPVRPAALRFQAQKDCPFAFSCLPYTASELENALHQEELPPPRRTVLCICGAVRGVGGIDSWGADVEAPYRVDAEKDRSCTFYILPPDERAAQSRSAAERSDGSDMRIFSTTST